MVKSITHFLFIFFIFQQLKSKKKSQIYQNGYNPFCDETLHIQILLNQRIIISNHTYIYNAKLYHEKNKHYRSLIYARLDKVIWVKTLNDVQLAPKWAKFQFFIRLKKLILAKSPICQLQDAPDYTGFLPGIPFLFKVECYHVTSANISDFKRPIFSRFH